MRKESLRTLGSEWEVTINEELLKLKQSDRMLLGDVAGVFIRSDAFLGRPDEDCNEDNESYLAVFYPSKYSIVCNKSFDAKTNAGSKWKLMSLDNFVEKLFEFNFTYLQMLYNESSLYESDVIKALRENINTELKTEYCKQRFIHKNVALLYGVLNDFNKGKFRDDAFCRDRVFLVLKAMQVIDFFVEHNEVIMTNKICDKDYNTLVSHGLLDGKLKYGVLGELNHRAHIYGNKFDTSMAKNTGVDEYRVNALEFKYKIMENVISNILK